MITKEMLAKCQNESGQAFAFMPKDVQQAMLDNTGSHRPSEPEANEGSVG